MSISNPNSNSVGMPAREVTPGLSDSHDENDIFFPWSGVGGISELILASSPTYQEREAGGGIWDLVLLDFGDMLCQEK